MKEHIHTSLHRIKGLAAQGASEVRERKLLTQIYDEAEKALRQDREEERQKKQSTPNPDCGTHVPPTLST